MKIMHFQLYCIAVYLIFYSCSYFLMELPVLNLKLANIVYGAVVEGDLSFEDIVNFGVPVRNNSYSKIY